MPFGELPLPRAATVRAPESWRRPAPDSTEWPRGIGTQMPQKESEKFVMAQDKLYGRRSQRGRSGFYTFGGGESCEGNLRELDLRELHLFESTFFFCSAPERVTLSENRAWCGT